MWLEDHWNGCQEQLGDPQWPVLLDWKQAQWYVEAWKGSSGWSQIMYVAWDAYLVGRWNPWEWLDNTSHTGGTTKQSQSETWVQDTKPGPMGRRPGRDWFRLLPRNYGHPEWELRTPWTCHSHHHRERKVDNRLVLQELHLTTTALPNWQRLLVWYGDQTTETWWKDSRAVTSECLQCWYDWPFSVGPSGRVLGHPGGPSQEVDSQDQHASYTDCSASPGVWGHYLHWCVTLCHLGGGSLRRI